MIDKGFFFLMIGLAACIVSFHVGQVVGIDRAYGDVNQIVEDHACLRTD